jgi:hypothetical protein
MSAIPIIECKVLCAAPNVGKPCETWYKVFGDLKSGIRPVVVHLRGPGIPSNYMLSFHPHFLQMIMRDVLPAGDCACTAYLHIPQ